MTRAMRILFFGSSLEPGRDGVGDYIRRLAQACARQSHVCAMVALNDPFVTQSVTSDEVEGEIPTLRLPAEMGWRERITRAWEFGDRFRPEWISLHLVPYAFHRKGILFGLIPTFRALTRGTPVHLMFHELYVGAGRRSSFRHHLVGGLQAAAIRRLLGQLQPAVVTTSNPVYAAMLGKMNCRASVLPLFGNIPLFAASEIRSIARLLPRVGMTPQNRRDWWVGLFFGAMHEQWKPEPFFSILLRAAKRSGKKICLVLAGRSSRTIWTQLERDYAGHLVLADLGEQASPMLSSLLQSADFGVACSPWQLVGKSGTVAAMLDHGLPVIVTRDDFQPLVPAAEPPSSDPLVHRCDDQLEEKLVAGLPKREPRARVDEIAAQLCGALNQASPRL